MKFSKRISQRKSIARVGDEQLRLHTNLANSNALNFKFQIYSYIQTLNRDISYLLIFSYQTKPKKIIYEK